MAEWTPYVEHSTVQLHTVLQIQIILLWRASHYGDTHTSESGAASLEVPALVAMANSCHCDEMPLLGDSESNRPTTRPQRE